MVERQDEAVPDNPEWGPANTRPVGDASQRLRVARATLGLTQAGMAALLGVSVATVRNWEQRRVEPDDAARTLIRLLADHPHDMHAMLRSTEEA
jgi:putative transcriptional regulator